MRHEYVGDIGDFGKYALLKALAGNDLTLGVVWYLNVVNESNNDGCLPPTLNCVVAIPTFTTDFKQ